VVITDNAFRDDDVIWVAANVTVHGTETPT
jgi:hypothetical protein